MSKVSTIIIAGKNELPVQVIEYLLVEYAKLNIKVIPAQSDDGKHSWQRSLKKFCKDNKVEMITLDESFLLSNSIFLSLEFDKIIAPEKFSCVGLFNIHFSYLPMYKGMYTSALPLLHGQSYSGVSLHSIDSGIDTGDIIDQRKICINNIMNARLLYLNYVDVGVELVKNNLESLINNSYVAERQNYEGSTYFSKSSIDYSKLSLDLNRTAWQVYNNVRAFSFRCYQLLKFKGKSISFCKILNSKSECRPGVVLEEAESFLKVSTVDYDVMLIVDELDLLLKEAASGNLPSVIRILELNPSLLFEKNEKGWGAIIVAAYNGQLETVSYLVDIGANVNDQNVNGTTVLMYAKNYCVEQGDFDLMVYLISEGAKADIADYSGKTIHDYMDGSNDILARVFLTKSKDK
ncbi:formyltransferase family protein [Echinimonas agarilytica]|uniref:Ankyrin repeat domain-containing protein n=1 Tax=Echinimonas agarilytica TaxID=1215918 RepID=A0AA42B8E7_9GAMM|nr:formyltransferase family protein [Echinimonas agarilytica]MCM2680126.1 ankyrin repeat domain-containing protein [Echinimonas agarilytica]